MFQKMEPATGNKRRPAVDNDDQQLRGVDSLGDLKATRYNIYCKSDSIFLLVTK